MYKTCKAIQHPKSNETILKNIRMKNKGLQDPSTNISKVKEEDCKTKFNKHVCIKIQLIILRDENVGWVWEHIMYAKFN